MSCYNYFFDKYPASLGHLSWLIDLHCARYIRGLFRQAYINRMMCVFLWRLIYFNIVSQLERQFFYQSAQFREESTKTCSRDTLYCLLISRTLHFAPYFSDVYLTIFLSLSLCLRISSVREQCVARDIFYRLYTARKKIYTRLENRSLRVGIIQLSG